MPMLRHHLERHPAQPPVRSCVRTPKTKAALRRPDTSKGGFSTCVRLLFIRLSESQKILDFVNTPAHLYAVLFFEARILQPSPVLGEDRGVVRNELLPQWSGYFMLAELHC